ncbi:MAG: Na-K-Cl cotransporter [Acidobacteria bacterium]|nr:Na-K-Cl cotransporter [Acidobacteriota bacterium]
MKFPFLRNAPPPAAVVEPNPGGLGTFGGVFTPSILTILGVIMYLRFGWILGNAGLTGTLVIVTLSTAITFLTALSISEIATDQHVRAGGAYYMISRALGVESGGTVGIPLYIAQALSVALYTVGFAESLNRTFPVLDAKITGVITTILIAALAMRSAQVAIKAQYFIMAAIAISLVSLFLGDPISAPMTEPVVDPAPFWVVFAVFFPAVTGIMAGVNMSGDLRNPRKSIPTGTIAAVIVGYVIYMAIPLYLRNNASAELLVADPLVMTKIAFIGNAILLGVWGATLSSALGSILGAPRVLQALARDGVLPNWMGWLGRGSGAGDEPRIGTVFTTALALVAVWLGDLDVIAPVLTMFFLTTYGVLNITAGLERFLQSPSFRPTFRVHWAWSLLGALGCISVMFLINPVATVVAFLTVLTIYLWLERSEMSVAWGDIRRGMWLTLIRTGLMRLEPGADPKTWRPHILVLSGAPSRRWHLVDLANSLSHNRGLMTVASILDASVPPARRVSMESTVREYLLDRGVSSLVKVISAPSPFEGVETLIEAYGLGPVMPNTIMVGGTAEEAKHARFCEMIRHVHESKRNILIVENTIETEARKDVRRIDVWWGGLRSNGGLMLLLAYLLKTSFEWRGSRVVLKMAAADESAAQSARANLESLTTRSRTGIEYEVIVMNGKTFDEILQSSSKDADLVFMGLAEPGDDFPDYYERTVKRSRSLPTTVFVLAAEDVDFGATFR